MSAPTWCHPGVSDRIQASCTCILQATCEKFNRLASLFHAHPIVHELDDLDGSVYAGGFGEGFQ
jgi:hypothetical protein